MQALRYKFALLAILVFPLAVAACSKVPRSSGPAEPSAEAPPAALEEALPWQALAVLKTGDRPIWLEFASGGCRPIDSPAEASLADFAPWPYARHCAGFLLYGSDLVAAVNRDGFLALSPREGGLVLHRAADQGSWDPYTVASVFVYGANPAVLLYRDDFFKTPEAPAPDSQVMVLSRDRPAPLGVSVPAFDVLPRSEGWELNSLRRGPDGNWYFRLAQTGYPRPGTAFYRTGDLSGKGEKVSLGDYRNSSRPEPLSNAPDFIKPLADALPRHFPAIKGSLVLRLLSPDFEGTRLFAVSRFAEENNFVFSGFFRGGALAEAGASGPGNDLAFVAAANGEGLCLSGNKIMPFSLPPLPDGFVYTGAGLVGSVLAASWEEQDESAIGAAGLMVLDAEAAGLF